MSESPPPVATRFQRFRRFVLRRLLFYPLIYVVVVLVFLLFERSLVFHPTSPTEEWLDPVDPKTTDISFTDAEGTRLHGWWSPPDDPASGAVLVAYGNGGNVTHRGLLAANLRRILRTGVLLFDYPGYGKSEGRSTEAGCYAAGEAAYHWLVDDAKIAPLRIVLLGESLGGGTAVELATRHEHRGLALVYTFTSLPDAAKFHYPWLPTKMLMRTRFENLSKLERCTRPVFIAHGTADQVVPFRQGEELFAAAKEPKEFFRMEGVNHSVQSGDGFYQALAKFLDRFAP